MTKIIKKARLLKRDGKVFFLTDAGTWIQVLGDEPPMDPTLQEMNLSLPAKETFTLSMFARIGKDKE